MIPNGPNRTVGLLMPKYYNPWGSTPEIVAMKKLGRPLTMESYLNFVYGGEVPPEGAELELDIPPEILLSNGDGLSDQELEDLGYTPEQIKIIQEQL